MIIFHELGHCDLDRKHEPNHTLSLMIKDAKTEEDYVLTLFLFKYDLLHEDERQRLYEELFDLEKINNNEKIKKFKKYEELYFSN